MKLSVAMIVKNEEKNIKRTLMALNKLQNYICCEIVIVDTGSKDNTVQIAKQYTDKIYFHKWNNNFADMRNISLNYCTGDWVLVVDADEFLYDVKELANLINSKKIDRYNSVFIKIIGFYRNIEQSIEEGNVCSMCRLFKRKTVKYQGSIHEQPVSQGPVLDANIRFVHYGYDNDNYELMEYKFKRNLNLLMQELKKDPNNIYIIYQIAVSYNMHNDLPQALKYIQTAYEKCKNQVKRYMYVLNLYCIILNRLEEYDLLLKKSQEALQYEDFIDFYFYYGEALSNLNRYSEAIEAYMSYLNSYEKMKHGKACINSMLIVNTKGLKNGILYNLSFSYYKKGLYEKALNTMLKIDDSNLLKDKSLMLLKIIFDGKKFSQISCLYEIIDKYNYENILNYIYKDVLLEDLLNVNEKALNGDLKEIITIVKYFKENCSLDKNLVNKVKKIINRNKVPYETYVYYVLKYDINEIKNLISYGKDRIENIMGILCKKYFDFNSILLNGLNEFNGMELIDLEIKAMIEKSLLLSGKLPEQCKERVFLSYIAHKYYCILKTYNVDLIYNNTWILNEEERFIVELKGVFQYKYKSIEEYIKGMKYILNINKEYVEYIKIILKNVQEPVSQDMKDLTPVLVENIQMLMSKEQYQEAYDTIEEGLSLIKFDFDLMMLKYNLLLNFNYYKEANECLKEIILYGEDKKVQGIVES